MNFTNTPAEDMVRTSRSKRRRARMMVLCAVAPIAAALAPTARAAVHLSGVVAGTASISQNGAITTIRTSNNAILNFSQFNVALGSTVDFLQPSAASRELDHVNSATPSLVNGSIVSNGTVYLVNPAGVIFGPGAVVNVNGIYVAGSHMADQDFLNNANHFSSISGIVSNSGQIRANQVYLIGSQVFNQGSIVAPNGMVAMLAGSDVLVSQQGSHVTAKVVPVVSASANSSQTDLRASALAAGDVYSLAIRHTGAIQAANVLINGGGGQVQVSGSIDASSHVAGTTGGTVAITGGQVNLVSADIDADGPAGGGTVDIGGGPHGGGDLAHADSVSLDSGTILNADATNNGSGGSITLWSDTNTSSSAILTARGGLLGGNGGTIETSGEYVSVTQAPNASAPHGKAGTWLLDPVDIEIESGADDGNFNGPVVFNQTIVDALNGGSNVTITTNQAGATLGNLTQDSDAIIAATPSATVTLTLEANATMDLSGGITSTGSPLNVVLDQLGASTNTMQIDTNSININGSLTISGGSVTTLASVTAATVQIAPSAVGVGSVTLSSPVATTGPISIQSSGPISISSAVTTAGGAFSATGTSFTTTPGGTINTTGVTNGEVDINPLGAVSIGDTITTGSGSSGGGGIYIDYGSSGSPVPAANGTIGISAAITTGGGSFFAGGTTFTANTGGAIATSSGKVTLKPSAGIILDAAFTTGGGVFSSTGTSFTSNTGGTINTTGTTNGEVDIDPNGAVSIGDTITTGLGGVVGGGVYLEYGSSSSAAPAANGTIDISAAIATGGGVFRAGGTSFTSTTGGTINTAGTTNGEVDIAPNGAVSIGDTITTGSGSSGGGGIYLEYGSSGTPAPAADGTIGISAAITTGGGSFFAGGTTFTANTGGTIATSGGKVTIKPSAGVNLDAAVTTGGGAFSSTGTSFTSTTGGTINTTGATNGEVDIDPNGAVSIGNTITTGSGSSGGGGIYLEYGSSSSAAPAANGTIGISAAIATGGGSFFAGGTTFTANTGGTIATSSGNVTIKSSAGINLDAAVTTGGGVFSSTGTSFTSTTGGTINTTGATNGEVDIDPNGAVSIGNTITTGSGSSGGGGIYLEYGSSGSPAPAANGTIGISAAITTGGGSLFAGGTTFTVNTGGTIATSGGKLTILPSAADVVDAAVTTGGGVFHAAGTSFTNNASGTINTTGTTDGEVDINPAGPISLGGTITTGSGSGGAGIYLDFGTSASPVAAANGTIGISAAIATAGGGFFAGGTTFTANAGGTISTGGGTVTIQPNAGIILDAAVTTGGGLFSSSGTSFTNNAGATINTTGATNGEVDINPAPITGAVSIGAAITTGSGSSGGGGIFIEYGTSGSPAKEANGTIGISAAITTGGGNFFAGGTTFTTTTGGTIATSGGNVTISPSTGISIGANVDTGGGAFTATGQSFVNNANISDDGVSTGSNGLSINTTSSSGALDTIDINGAVTWTNGTGRSVVIEGGGNVTIATDGSITGGGALPVSLYTTGQSTVFVVNNANVTYNNVTLNGIVTTTGPFVSAGGNFTVAAPSATPTPTILTASTVTLNNASVTPDSKTLFEGSVTLSGPVLTTGAFLAAGTASYTQNLKGTVNTQGGACTISNDGAITLGAAITTGGGAFTSTLGTSFTTSGSGTIATTDGSVNITTTGGNGISIGAFIGTSGGAFTAAGSSFTASAAISDGGVATGSNAFSVNTTSGNGSITISAPINWSGGAGRSVLLESAGDVDITSTGRITATGAGVLPVSLYTTGFSASITVSGIIDTTGAFVSAGGDFTITEPSSTPAPTILTASTVTLNTATATPDGQTVNNGTVTVSGPVVTNGPFVGGGTVLFTDNEAGTVNTHGGSYTISNTGLAALGQPITTGGGNFFATGGAGFTSAGFGTIATAGGSVTIATTESDGITIGASINTGGGGFSATGEAFSSSATITDGGVATPNGALLISTTTGNQINFVDIGGAINWAGGTGRSVTIEGPYTFNINGNITSTGAVPLKVVIDSTSSSGTININAAVAISGAFVSDGGAFMVASTGSVTALTVALETNATTPDGQPVAAGPVTIDGPIVTHGGFTVNSPDFSESASTGTITTNGGVVSITTTDSSAGSITLESAVSTGGGAFTVNSASSFTSSGAGTVNTGGGAVTIQAADTTTGISIGAVVNTGGGNFAATAPIFTNTAEITDGGVNDSNPAGLTITTTGNAIFVEGPISWAASHSPITFSYPTNFGVALDGDISVNDAEPVNFTNVFIALTGSGTITGGNVTMGTVVNGVNGGEGSLTIQSAGTVSLQGIGSSSSPIGSLTITGNNSAAPVTTLNGSIFAVGNVDFAGTVIVPTGVEIGGANSAAQTLEFDGTIEGPGQLVVADAGSVGDVIRFNNNIGDQTPLGFLDLYPGAFGIVAFRWGTGLFPPGVLEQQPLTTVNIASGGDFEVNDFNPTTRTNYSTYATIDSYGPLTINVGAGAANKSNLYAVGQNEKLSVYGALTINANGGTVKTGDISTTGNLTLKASIVDFMLRGPTLSSNTEIDTGMDLISGGEMSLPANATYAGVKGSNGVGSFDVPGFVATSFNPSTNIAQIAGQLGTAFSIVPYISPSLLFGGGNLLLDLAPSTLSATIPTFVPPTPYVYEYPISGAAPREMLTAGTLPLDFKDAFQPVYPGPVVQQDLKDTGVLTRDPTADEILGEVDTGAIYDDLPQGPRPKPADYRAAASRLDPRSVQAFLTKYTEVFGSNPQSRKVQMSTDIQAAWDAYVSQSGDQAVSGWGFAQYCAGTPSASNAQADLRQLHGLREQLATLGLSYKEAQVAFQYNILAGMSANGMRAGDLAAAAAGAGGSH